MTENTRPRLVKPETTFSENVCLHGQAARAGPRCSCGGMNQYRSIEQVAARNVQRIVMSGPCRTSRCGEKRSTSELTKPPERSAITVIGVGLGDGDGVLRRCQVPAGLPALRALMNVHSMHRPRGVGLGVAERDVPGTPSPVGGGHGPGGEL